MLVTVATYRNPIEAYIVRGRLECEGAEAYVCHEHHIWADWTISQALGEVKIQVPLTCSGVALDVITSVNKGEYLDALINFEPSEKEAQCIKCNSNKISRVNRPWKLSLIMLYFFSFPIPYTTMRVKCESCGATWTDKEGRYYPTLSIGIVLLGLFGGVWLLVTGAEYLCKITTHSYMCN